MFKRIPYLILLLIVMLAVGCSTSKQAFDPGRKYPVQQLQQDYHVFRGLLEESHPSLYWFTSKDSMNYYFDQGYEAIKDSMTEPQFRNLLSFVANKIHCGHTSVKYSKKYTKYLDTVSLKMFPLSLKVWSDSMAVVSNLNRRDSVLTRGTIITGINGYPFRRLTDTFSNYVSGDGYVQCGKYQVLSNRGMFGALYRTVLGLSDRFTVDYIDTAGLQKETIVPVYDPGADTGLINFTRSFRAVRGDARSGFLNGARSLQVDTVLSSGYMTVNTFARGNQLRSFFKTSFRELKARHIHSLVIDVRSNGGGDAGLATMLTRYVAAKKFKLADSLYAVRRSSQYGKYIQLQPLYWAMMQFVTHKESDGYYHFGYFERHYFHPFKKHHFNGDVYVIIGGNSFSATTLFAKVLKGQSNVTIVGEETGGGAYGNTAWMIPDVTLPNTRVRFRLPKFRLVMDESLVKTGRGIIPDIEAVPTVESIRKGIDPKVEIVRKIIMQKNGVAHQ